MSAGRIVCLIAFVISIVWAVGCGVAGVLADYEYENKIVGYWNLSDKASTIQQKSIYLDQFVTALESAGLADNDALFLNTPDNSAAQNMTALRSLQGRMHEIIGMDPNSFQYQAAMQQITAQEQGEAKAMLERLEGAWYKTHHFFLWGCVGIIHGILILTALVLFGIFGCSSVLD